jgi:UDPglucose 6-dehydrogenase
LLKALTEEGAILSVYDPEASSNASEVLPEVRYCSDPYQAAVDAEAILIVTEWDEFRAVDWERLSSLVERPLLIDGRNMFSPEEVTSRGFRYVSIGRPPSMPSDAGAQRSPYEVSAAAPIISIPA